MCAPPLPGFHPLARFVPHGSLALQASHGPAFGRHLLSYRQRIMGESSRQGKYDTTNGLIYISRSRATAAQAFGEALAEFLAPAPDGLIGDNNAPLGKEQLNVSQAEAENVVQPDIVRDDLGGEAMAVAWVGWRLHTGSLAGLQAACQTQLP